MNNAILYTSLTRRTGAAAQQRPRRTREATPGTPRSNGNTTSSGPNTVAAGVLVRFEAIPLIGLAFRMVTTRRKGRATAARARTAATVAHG